MSEQVRFKIEGCKVNPDLASICITFVKDENGEYVRYEDYARLKAEVEELTHDANEADQQYEHAISRVRRLEAEVERLRKAGDELLHEWSSGDETDGRNFIKGLALWNAAKEGKPQS